MAEDVPGKGRPFNARPIVIASAVRLFGQRGYLGTSINDIATDAGVTKGAIFHHFKRKSDLLLEVHESFIEILLARAESRTEAQLRPKEELRALLGDVMWLMDNMMDYVRVFFDDWRHIDPADLVPIKAKRDRYARHMTDVLRAGVDEGDFRPMDPELTTLFAFGIVNWAYQWYSSSGALDAEAIADAMFAFICQGIEAEPRARG